MLVIPKAPEEPNVCEGNNKGVHRNSHTTSVAHTFFKFSNGVDLNAPKINFGKSFQRSKKDMGTGGEVNLPYQCDLCDYKARWPSEMTQHKKNHSDEKPFLCPQCPYR